MRTDEAILDEMRDRMHDARDSATAQEFLLEAQVEILLDIRRALCNTTDAVSVDDVEDPPEDPSQPYWNGCPRSMPRQIGFTMGEK